jgi:hypothetical protein
VPLSVHLMASASALLSSGLSTALTLESLSAQLTASSSDLMWGVGWLAHQWVLGSVSSLVLDSKGNRSLYVVKATMSGTLLSQSTLAPTSATT